MRLTKKDYQTRIDDLNSRIRLCLDTKENLDYLIREHKRGAIENLEQHMLVDNLLKKQTKPEHEQELDNYISRCVALRKEYKREISPDVIKPALFLLTLLVGLFFFTGMPGLTGLATLNVVEGEVLNDTILFERENVPLSAYVTILVGDYNLTGQISNLINESQNATNPTVRLYLADYNISLSEGEYELTVALIHEGELLEKVVMDVIVTKPSLDEKEKLEKKLQENYKKLKVEKLIKNLGKYNISIELNGVAKVFSSKKNKIEFYEMNVSDLTFVEVVEPTNDNMKTEILAVQAMNFSSSKLFLLKKSEVNAILHCQEWNFESKKCDGLWGKLNVSFDQDVRYVWFTTDMAGAYAGGDIDILNVQSYPTLGGEWEVRFTTIGKEDLIITAVNGTTWSDSSETEDLKFLKVMCGDTELDYEWVDGSVVVRDYECDLTGSETSKVLTNGEHHLKFEFGWDTEYAHNYASEAFKSCRDLTISLSRGNLTEYVVWYEFNSNALVDRGILTTDSWQGNNTDIAIINNTNGEVDADFSQDWNSSYTVVRFKVPYIINTTDLTYKMCWGNSSISSPKRNWSKIYRFSDNFDGSSVDTTVWYEKFSGSVSNSVWTAINSRYLLANKSAVGINASVPNATRLVTFGSFSTVAGVGLNSELTYNSQDRIMYFDWWDGQQRQVAQCERDDVQTSVLSREGLASQWSVREFRWGQNNVTFWLNNKTGQESVHYVMQCNNMDNVPHDIQLYPEIFSGSLSGISVDWIKVMEYSDIEPTISANAVPVTSNLVLNSTPTSANGDERNLTLYYSSSDSDGDSVYNITDWRMNGSSIAVLNLPFENHTSADSIVYDYSTYGNDGTVTSATWTSSGYYGGAYDFDGIDDGIAHSDTTNSEFDINESITLEVWLKADSITTSNAGIVRKDGSYILGLANDGKLFASYVGCTVLSSTTAITTGTWMHAVWTYDGTTTGTNKLYINGVLNNSNVETSCTPVIANGAIQIGMEAARFNGTIDEVKIFNRALSPEQIKQNYNNRTDIIVSNETITGELWKACVTPNDGHEDGGTVCSYDLQINTVPVTNNVILNTTDMTTNYTSENLTLYWNSSDPDGDPVYNITDWRIDGTSIAVLNMLFENHTSVSTLAYDYSTYGNDGTVIGATFNSTGGFDGSGAYQFDGSNDYITITDTDDSLDLQDFTISMWIKPGSSQVAYAMPLDKRTVSGYWGLIKDWTAANEYNFRWQISTGAWMCAAVADEIKLTADVWQHLVITKDYRTVNIYRDGILNKTCAATNEMITKGGYDVTIGAGNGGSYPWNGAIDSLIILDRPLSVEQIQVLYENRTDLIVSQDTKGGENWSVRVTPNDGTGNYGAGDGTASISNNQIIINNKPNSTNRVLNSSSLTNLSSEDLTVYFDAADGDSESILNITDWRIDGTSMAVLNMPFEYHPDKYSVAYDYSTYGNNATVIDGAEWTSEGKVGGTYLFRGGDCLGVPDDTSLQMSGNFTFEFWGKFYIMPAGYPFITKWGAGAGGYNYMFDTSGNKMYFRIRADATSGTNREAISANTYNDGEWHHYAGVFNGSHVLLYVDGGNSERVVGAAVTGPLDTGTAQFNIGGYYSCPHSAGMWGYLDEIKVYDRTLSAEQINASYLAASANHSLQTIASQETSLGDVWSVAITPNDGAEDGTTVFSNNLTISNIVNFTQIYPNQTGNLQNITTEINVSLNRNASSTNLTFNVTAQAASPETLTFRWFVDGILKFTENIVSGFTSMFSWLFNAVGQQNVTAIVNGTGVSDTFTFYLNLTNDVPVVNSVVLNSTNISTNYTFENLTLYWNSSDPQSGAVYNITDWRIDGTSIAVLNLPFEKHANSATKAIDYSSYSNNGTVTSATWTQNGYYGGAYSFSGAASEYISTTLDLYDLYTASGEFSVSVWSYDTEGSGNWRGLVNQFTGGAYHGFFMRRAPSGSPNFGCSIVNSGSWYSVTASSSPDVWEHWVCSLDSGGTVRLYKNGVEVGTPATSAAMSDSGGSFIVGANYIAGTGNWMGKIDQVMVFNKSLSPEQIFVLAQNRTDLIVSNETGSVENWSACVTPNDGVDDGTTQCSNAVSVTSPCIDTDNDGFGTGVDRSQCTYSDEDCDDTSAAVRPPIDNEQVNASVTFCPGTYTLDTGIDVVTNNTIVACNGTIIKRSGTSNEGIDITGTNNVTVKGCTISGYAYSIDMNLATNSTIIHNRMNSSTIGLYLNYAYDGNITNNTIYSTGSEGIDIYYSDRTAYINNNLTSTAGIDAAYSPNSRFENNYVKSSSTEMLYLEYDSENWSIKHNIFEDGLYGVYLGYSDTSSNNTFINNTISGVTNAGSPDGLYIKGYTNLIENNTMFNNSLGAGIRLIGNNNTLNYNNIYNNDYGIYIGTGTANNNTILDPNITSSTTADIFSYSAFYNTLKLTEGNNELQFYKKKLNITDLDNLYINNYIASVNSTAEPYINTSANITLVFPGSCPARIYYYNQFTTSPTTAKQNGQICDGTTTPACSNIVCSGNTVSFNVPHFDTYSATNNTKPNATSIVLNSTSNTNLTTENLTLYWDSADGDGDSVYNVTDWRVGGTSIAVLNMPFENHSNASSFVYDYTTYKNNGTITNAKWNSSGYYGGAYTFDGTTDFISLQKAIFNITNGTLSAWIKTGGAGSSYRVIVAKDTAWGIFLKDEEFGVHDWGTAQWKGSGAYLNDSKWHFVAITFNNGVTDGTTFYVDGNENGTTKMSAAGYTAVPAIGAYNTGVFSFNGIIDQVQIFNRTLSPEQILQLYNNRTDIVVRNETTPGDVWQACIIPNDGIEDGTTSCSNSLTVLNLINFTQIYPNQTGNLQNITTEINVSLNRNASQTNLTFNVTAQALVPETLTFRWFINNVLKFTENIVSGFTSMFSYLFNAVGQYNVTAVVNGTGSNDTFTFLLNITNDLPVVNSVILNSTLLTNHTDENLTVYWNSSDPQGDTVYNITDWRVDGTSIAVLNMPFEKHANSATKAIDYSTYSNNGSVSGATWTSSGYYGGAYEFNGVDNYIQISSTDFSILTGNYALVAWFKTGDTKSYNTLFSIDDYDPGFYVSTDRLTVYDGSDLDSNTGLTLADNQWHHVAFVREGTGTNQLKFYLDGSSVGTADHADSISSSGTVYVGWDAYSPDEFNGTIDGLMFFNRSLSPEQVLALYNNRTDLILSNETNKGERWEACLTPNDGVDDGTTVCSNNLTIRNTKPVTSNVILNSTLLTNLTTENLTVYWSSSDIDLDSIYNITDWRIGGTSIAVLNMPFEAGSSNSTWTKDYTTYGNNGTLNATWTSSGYYGGAYTFDGTSSGGHIRIADDPSFDLSSNMTISAWVKTTPFQGAGWQTIISQGDATWRLQNAYTSNKIIFGTNGPSGGINLESTTALTAGKWYHVVAHYDGINKSIYINGALNVSIAATGSIATSPYDVCIGENCDPIARNRYWNGSIDEVVVYNRALSPEQILALYNNRTDLILSNETNKGERWEACLTPNDGEEDGTTVCSNNLTIANKPPTASNVILNSSLLLNTTAENLTAYWSASDVDSDSIYNITDWRIDGTSMALVNMPFEKHANSATKTRDYSTNGNNGTITRIDWTEDGYIGGGYDFLDPTYQSRIWINESTIDWNNTDWTITLWATQLNGTTGQYNGLVSNRWSWKPGWFTLGTTTDGMLRLEVAPGQYISTNYYPAGKGWLFYTVRKTGNTMEVWINNSLMASGSVASYNNGDKTNELVLGYWEGQATCWNGTMDNFIVFNRSLSNESIQALYESRTDLIVSQETITGEVWSACLTPNDGTADGATVCSNNLTILNIINFTQIYPNQTGNLQNITTEINVSLNRNASPTTSLTFNVTAQAYDSETLTFRWFVNSVLKFTENIVSGFTSMFSYLFNAVGQYNVTAVVNGTGANDTFTFLLNITNDLPVVNSVILNSTLLTNHTDENLTVYWNSSDPQGDTVYNITDWRIGGTSIALVNYPFEKHANSDTFAIDYSTNKDNLTNNGATWTQNGYYGGAYSFNAAGYMKNDINYDVTNNNVTLSCRFKLDSYGTNSGICAIQDQIYDGGSCMVVFVTGAGNLRWYGGDVYQDIDTKS
ncbi:LamG-like jellyroll fold domain-containing protein, partial [Nanoarchaeota archaeon]